MSRVQYVQLYAINDEVRYLKGKLVDPLFTLLAYLNYTPRTPSQNWTPTAHSRTRFVCGSLGRRKGRAPTFGDFLPTYNNPAAGAAAF